MIRFRWLALSALAASGCGSDHVELPQPELTAINPRHFLVAEPRFSKGGGEED